ncbi:hypothetical protein L9F63_023457, partial [Diploptera punctata]
TIGTILIWNHEIGKILTKSRNCYLQDIIQQYTSDLISTNNYVYMYPRGVTCKFGTLKFPELPDGKPIITTAHNTSATSLHISWKPPNRDTIHGEFLGYRIEYRPRDRGQEAVKEIYIRDSTVDNENYNVAKQRIYLQFGSAVAFERPRHKNTTLQTIR